MFMWHDPTWMWLSTLVVWSFAALVILRAVKAWSRPAPAQPQRRAADERHARGEISAEEYRESRQTLERTATHGSGR